MALTPVPRMMIKAGLFGLRLPLTTVERVTGNADAEAWPPAMAFDALEATTKRVLGSVIRDEQLVREGELQRAKLDELATAQRLETRAQQLERQADAKLEERVDAAEKRRQSVETEAAKRKREAEEQAAKREREIAQQTREREQAAREAEERRAKVVSVTEREAEKVRIREERDALAVKREALAASRTADVLEDAIEQKKAKRKSS